ncbi:hypothetical protein T4C_12646 [Trichinella pseudospiralis]|uniref:Uncharacterized protein n=1 Tax=Trichinella pseudospiralis TaxID=6337 RepID=A0A0V1GD88_TRIPS|nr:hypothetical protein T4C_12646 [Trichinella pseudospiralis]
MLLRVIDDATLSHLLVPALLSDLNLSSDASNVTAHGMKRSNNFVLNFLNR